MLLGIDIWKCSKPTTIMGVATGVALGASTDVAMGAAIGVWQTGGNQITKVRLGIRQHTQDRRIKKPYQENSKYFCEFSL